MARASPDQTGSITLLPDGVQHTGRAKLPAVRGDTAWIGCFKGKSKNGLLDASSDFLAQIGNHMQVSTCKSNAAADMLCDIAYLDSFMTCCSVT